MIYTVTLNPAVDRELTIDAFSYNTVLRASDWRVDYGGKGFNVSRMLRILGQASTALGFAGGKAGELLADGLADLEIPTDFVWVADETRTNVSIVSRGEGCHIKVNEPGPTISEEAQQALLDKVTAQGQPGDWWVLAGSLPPGVPDDYYGKLIRVLQATGASSVLDTSGPALRHGCKAGPMLAKPNAFEVSQLSGRPVESRAELLVAAGDVRALGVDVVVVSLGKDGAFMASDQGAAVVSSPAIEERNPIGAGDAMVAGLVYGLVASTVDADDQRLGEALRWGIACGATAAAQPGTAMGSRQEIEALRRSTAVEWLAA